MAEVIQSDNGNVKVDNIKFDLPNTKYSLIINSKKAQEVADSVQRITWTTVRVGEPSKLEFSLLKTTDLSFTEGDWVYFSVNGVNRFAGRIFEKRKTEKEEITVLCYDQLRYLKANQSYTFDGFTADEVIEKICKDFFLSYRKLEKTGYPIPSLKCDDMSLFDIVCSAIEKTAVGTGRTYNFYADGEGYLRLTAIEKMLSPYVLGDNSLVSSYTYTTSIDDSYNYVKLVQASESEGKGIVTILKSDQTMETWGKLQYYERVDSGASDAQVLEKAKNVLNYYNKKRRNLSLRSIGIPGIRAGSVVLFNIEHLGDMNLRRFLIVDTAKHTFEADKHTMDLDVQVVHELDSKFIPQYEKTTEYVGGSDGSGSNTSSAGVGGYRSPLVGGYQVSKTFARHPSLGKGIDLAVGAGTAIYPYTAGTVVVAKDLGNTSYGKYVKIKHPDGTYSLYAHMSKITVSVNDTVSTGTKIGEVGNTGNSTGNHLHFEIIVNGEYKDPKQYLKSKGVKL